MSKNGFDASIGLAFSLELFKRYRRNGVVQAELPRIPGMRGPCKAYLYLANGEVASAYLEDQQGQRHSSDKATLCRLDAEKGPFEWLFLPAGSAFSSSPLAESAPQSVPSQSSTCPLERSSVPKVIAALPQEQLQSWSTQQRDILYITFVNIDGENTVEEIRGLVPFASELVDEALHKLIEMKVIIISA